VAATWARLRAEGMPTSRPDTLRSAPPPLSPEKEAAILAAAR
jgi:hypothetical protein